MAASLQRIGVVICRTFPFILQRNIQAQRILNWKISAPVLRLNFLALSSSSSSSSADETDSAEVLSRYSDKPWEYLESEEYIERYGSKPVWSRGASLLKRQERPVLEVIRYAATLVPSVLILTSLSITRM